MGSAAIVLVSAIALSAVVVRPRTSDEVATDSGGTVAVVSTWPQSGSGDHRVVVLASNVGVPDEQSTFRLDAIANNGSSASGVGQVLGTQAEVVAVGDDAFVVSGYPSGGLSRMSLRSGKELWHVDFADHGSTPVPSRPRQTIAVTADAVFVTRFVPASGPTVVALDWEGRTIGSGLSGCVPKIYSFSPTTILVYCTNSRALALVHVQNGQLEQMPVPLDQVPDVTPEWRAAHNFPLNVEAAPQSVVAGVAADTHDGSIYVVTIDARILKVGSDGSRLWQAVIPSDASSSFVVPGVSLSVAQDTGELIVPLRDMNQDCKDCGGRGAATHLARVTAAGVVHTAQLPLAAWSMAVSADGSVIYAASRYDKRVYAISTTSTTSMSIDAYPQQLSTQL